MCRGHSYEFISQSSLQLNRLSEQMQESENRIIATAQYQGVFEKIAKIDTSLEMIPLMLKSYPRNRSRLLENIDDKLRNYGNLDSDLTNLVFVQSPATSQQSSLIDSIASLCTPEFQFCKIASSTNQVIFEFYKHIMVYISKVKVFQTLSYQIRQFLTGDNHSEDIEFVNNKVKRNMQKIMTSLRMTLTKYNDSKHLKSYLQMIKSPSEGYNYEKLQRVMYNAILREENLSSSNTCQETCPYYNRSSINHNACKGILYNCDYSGFYATYQVYSVNTSYLNYIICFYINYYYLNILRPPRIDTIQHIINMESGSGKTLIICLLDGIPGL